MTDEYHDRLIHGHLDDALSDAERHEFAALMRDSEAARRRFWDLAEVHGLARDAARLAWPEEISPTVEVRSDRAPLRSRLAHLHPAGLVAAGLVLGVLMTSLTWAIARPLAASAEVLLAEGFETAAAPLAEGVPAAAGVWSGDFTEIVAAQSGVAPAGGGRMLRFLRADYEGKPNPGGYIGEIYRLIDVRSLRGELAEGDAVAQVSAEFNAAPSDKVEVFHASLSLYALDTATTTDGTLRSGTTLLDRAQAVTRRSNQILDRDAASWQKMSTDLRLPSTTDFLLLRIAVAHGSRTRSASGHESFAAHYADDVRVVLARRPALP